jgi:alpha-methylacyl-CoA racemase
MAGKYMGPLHGVKIIEIAGIGPGPFAGMLLADMGAEVLRVERPHGSMASQWPSPDFDILNRGRRCVCIDLKHPDGAALVLDLVQHADGLFEGNRPGVMERLGLGPDVCLARNPRLIYGRMTGWGQDGPLAHAAGHDINYIALAGALDQIGRRGQPPTPPLNLVGDFGGGGLMLAFGMACALFECQRSGRGQVVDAAMVDGAAALMALFHGVQQTGFLTERGTNMFDSGAHFYDVYETADDKYVSIGPLEPKFYAELLRRLGMEEDLPQLDPSRWPELKERFARCFKTKTRQQWCEVLEGTDVCFAPVLSVAEAPRHPHNVARGTFVEAAGVVQPRPAPRFSRTPAEIQRPPARVGEHTEEALLDWGVAPDRIAVLKKSRAIA